MSNFTKKKSVIKEVTKDLIILPTQNQFIVKIVSSCGNNLHQVEDTKGEQFLVSMPTKFRRNVWISRKSFVLVEPIEEGVKVRAEITNILTQDHISYFNEEGVWPKEFAYAVHKRNSDDLYKTGYDPLQIVNHNRVTIYEPDSSSSDSENSSEEEQDESENSDEKEEDEDENENNGFNFIHESDSENSSEEENENEKSDELKDENNYLSENKSNSAENISIRNKNISTIQISSKACDIKNDEISEKEKPIDKVKLELLSSEIETISKKIDML